MSITRLRQARQMYAMGQRVGRIAFGGGGTQGGGAYQGGGRDPKGSVSGSAPGAATGGGGGSSADSSYVSDTQQYNHNEAISKNTKVDNNPLRPSGIKPGFIKPGDIDNLTLRPYEQDRVDFLDTAYQPIKTPFMLLNTVGNFIGSIGDKKNKQFFADNVAGKHGFGFDMDSFKKYMDLRMSGEVGAYGNKEQGQNALNALSSQDVQGGQGIMDINTDNNVGDADGDGDVDQDDFIFKYFDKTGETLQAGAGGVEDLMSSIRGRINNLFS